MKNIFKKSVFALMFAFAFLLVGTAVRAWEVVDNNIDHPPAAEGYDLQFDVKESTYYTAKKNKDGEYTFKIVSTGAAQGLSGGPATGSVARYVALATVVKCAAVDAEGRCTDWKSLSYGNDAVETQNKILGDGLKINFNVAEYKDEDGKVYGVAPSTLTSIYGLADTYFVLVEYSYSYWAFFTDYYGSAVSVFKVVLADELPQLTISDNGHGVVTVTSGVPIDNIKYLKTTVDLENAAAFDPTYASAEEANKKEELTTALSNPKFANGAFIYSFEIENYDDSAIYNVKAVDISTHFVVQKLKAPSTCDTDSTNCGTGGTTDDEPPTLTSKTVGQIILISLIVIFVIALVLVIVQKIVDYRKRLY